MPRELAGLVHRAMAARPELRFATATEMRLALEKASSARRPGTGPMPQAGQGASQASVSPAPGQAPASRAPSQPAPAHAASNPGTSTDRPPNTERSPPVGGTAIGQAVNPQLSAQAQLAPPTPGYAGVAIPPPRYPAPRGRPGGAARTVALIALPLLVGAGIVMILMATGKWPPGSGPSTPPPPSTSATSTVATDDADAGGLVAPPTVATIPTNGAPSGIPTLAPTGRLPPQGPGPHPSGRPGTHPTSRPPSVPDAGGGPPPLFPSVLPPFPIPTAFPTLFPPWPGTPPPGPAPGNSGSI